MKNAKAPVLTKTGERPLRFRDFIRFAALLTLCIGSLIAIQVMTMAGDHELWGIAAFLILVPIWVGTLIAGCFVMIPVWVSRFVRRPTRKRVGKTPPEGRVWDQWMDGPEPM